MSGWYWLYVKTLSIPEFISSGDAAHPGMEQFLSFGHFVLFGAVRLLSIVWFAAHKLEETRRSGLRRGYYTPYPDQPGRPALQRWQQEATLVNPHLHNSRPRMRAIFICLFLPHLHVQRVLLVRIFLIFPFSSIRKTHTIDSHIFAPHELL